MSEFESRILDMLDKVRTLKRVIDEIEEPLEEFNEHLFREIAVDMEINNRDEMTVTLLGGLKFNRTDIGEHYEKNTLYSIRIHHTRWSDGGRTYRSGCYPIYL